MALPTASDNAFPSVLVTEGSAPSSPAAGKQRVYIDSTSHQLSRKNSAGTVVNLETNQAAGAPTAHGCRVHRASGDVSVGNNTFTVIGWNAEDHDTDTMHDNSTNPSRITIPSISGVTTGLWSMTVKGYTSATSGRTDVMFRMNANTSNSGGTQIGLMPGGAVLSGLNPIMEYEEWVLAAADYVEVFVRTTGGSFNLVFDSVTLPSFSMAFLGKVS